MNKNDVINYYASFRDREWQRLENPNVGAVEFAVTCHTLETYLPSDGRILDIGGGPGRYTIWLAQRGFKVVLADISPDMLSIAHLKIAEARVGDKVDAVIEADACDLSQCTDNTFDAVLSLGPFYHLTNAADRNQAALELHRVLRPGGLAFIALMPRYAFLRRTLFLPDERRHILQPEWISALMEKGIFENDAPGRFTGGYGVRPEEVAPFFEKHGFTTEKLLALEGFSAGLESVLAQLADEDPSLYGRVLQLIIDTADDASILGMSLHLLYVARKPERE